ATDSSAADSLANAPPASSSTGATSAAADSAVSGAIAAVSFGDLAATTAPPWVPATPVKSEEGWETAVRLPLRIVTYPLSLLGDAAKSGGVFVEEHSLVPRSRVVLGALPRQGIYVAPPSLGDRTGFGLALGYSPF